ncbi:MAG: hypothetical protein JWQ76_1209 [Ramlibacter sp.]|nr:hypothetical protein [Ramlibacter sp.]
MNRNLKSAIASAAVTAMGLLAAGIIGSATAYADEDPAFVSSRTREEVTADLKTPWPGGNPWSGAYNMFQVHGPATSAQMQGEYILSRDKVGAFHGEDSGSTYIMKAQGVPAPGSAGILGGPAR